MVTFRVTSFLYMFSMSIRLTTARQACISILMINLLSFLNLSSIAQAEIPMGDGKFNSLKIIYSIKSTHLEGSETFIQLGKKTFKELITTTTWHNLSNQEHTIEIDNGVQFYRINMLDKTAVALPSINKMKEEMVRRNPHLFNDILPSPLLITPKSPPLPEITTIMGKDCQVFAIRNKLLFIWNDILLKEIYEEIETVTKTATQLETNIAISEDYFNVPSHITILSSSETFNTPTIQTSVTKLPLEKRLIQQKHPQ